MDTSVLKYFGKRAEEFTESEVEALNENDIDEVDHDMNMRNLQYGFEQLGLSGDSNVDKRATTEVRLPLNIGAFIRKATKLLFHCQCSLLMLNFCALRRLVLIT